MADQNMSEEKFGFFQFKPHAEETQVFKTQPQDFKEDFDVVDAEYKQFEKELTEYKKKRLAIENEDEEKVKKLANGEEFVDRSGTAIPYKQKKKLGIFTVTESHEDYKKRVTDKLLKDYCDDVSIRTFARSTAEAQKEYYGNEDALVRVDLAQVRNNYSEQRRSMMKQALTKMAQEDLKMKNISSAENADFKDFLESMVAYGLEEGTAYRNNVDLKRTDISRVEKESLLFSDAFSKLEKLMSTPDLRQELIPILNGYYDMMRHLSSGSLKTEKIKEHEICETSSTIKYGDKKENLIKDRVDTPLFTHEPSISDVLQGGNGNCYLIAAITSLVASDPQYVKDCMKDNGDGSVTVRFFRTGINTDYKDGDDKKNMLISTPTYIRVPKVSINLYGARNALWVNIIEVAYAEFKRQSDVRKSAVDGFISKLEGNEKKKLKTLSDKVKKDYEQKKQQMFPDYKEVDFRKTDAWSYVNRMEQEILKNHEEEYTAYLKEQMAKTQKKSLDLITIKGGRESEAFASLTGHLHDSIRFSLEKKEDGFDIKNKNRFSGEYSDKQKNLFNTINEAIKNRKCVTCESELDSEGDNKKYEGLAASHAYTVLGTKIVNIKGKDVYFVRIRNPWGTLHTGYQTGGYDGSSLKIENLMDSATDGINEVELDDFYNRMEEITITSAPPQNSLK